MSLTSLPIQRVLGAGSIGKVFLVERNGQQYALKIEYILPSYLKRGGKFHNEKRFAKQVARHFPEKFIQLVDSSIVSGCGVKLDAIPTFLQPGMQEILATARKGRVCVYKLYTLVDTSLANIQSRLIKFSIHHRYSLLLQLLDILRVMDESKWVHGDFHPGNVGIAYVHGLKTVTVGRCQTAIPTYGTLVQAIDLSDVLHPDTLNPRRPYEGDPKHTELDHYKEHLWADRQILFTLLYDEEPYWAYVKKHDIPLSYPEDLEKIKTLPEFKKLRRSKRLQRLPDHLIFRMVHVLHTEVFERKLFGDKFKKVVPLRLLMPIEDVIYTFYHFFETDKLISHFLRCLRVREKC